MANKSCLYGAQYSKPNGKYITACGSGPNELRVFNNDYVN